jgi:uncharacterized protein
MREAELSQKDQEVDRFWRNKTLDEMSKEQWESLCDGCGRCCLNKIEDSDKGEIYLTKVACRLLELGSCRCRDYPNRQRWVPDCISLTVEDVRSISWLPPTCGYRLVDEGKDLLWWHPLVSGSPDTVHEAGISVRSWAKTERRIKEHNFEKYIIGGWPEQGIKGRGPLRKG